jgi:rhodanese-related sulfurtransferase
MTLPVIDAERAKALIDAGAVLIDIRERDEHLRERIPQARLQPMASLRSGASIASGGQPIIFHCKSGGRTQSNAACLSAVANCEAYILEGGLDAWRRAGLPVVTDRSQPIELMRQVQIAAGGAVVLGVVLGVFVTPWFYALSAFVGAGLIVAGATGFCGLARLLSIMPWNRGGLSRTA